MPSQPAASVENNFTKGLITEFTGLNFPENAATSTSNCVYTIVGDVTRREGFDYETNFATNAIDRANVAISTYKWDNAGGDGQTQVVVKQVGDTLYFYQSSLATISNPLSKTILTSTIKFSPFTALNGVFDPTIECQYTDGNGYLFVYHPDCDSFYCSFSAGVITALPITISIRDLAGISEPSLPVSTRPSTLTPEHTYNLVNQGWVKGSPWTALSSTVNQIVIGVLNFFIPAGLSVTVGDNINITNNHPGGPGGVYQPAGTVIMTGVVTGYSSGTLIVNITSVNPVWAGDFYNDWFIYPTSTGYINTWFTAVGVYPSNADVWWYYRNASNAFDPATTIANISLNAGYAPRGHFILNAFNQDRSLLSGVASITPVRTSTRPKTGTWFQGRVWYAGVDASQIATGDAANYTWTENIYFSKVVQSTDDFGSCYQTNDPTSSELFGLLPTDGGVIKIQGCGSIYKLFALMNALLVFAANGVWYISGSQGVGFAANDYTIVKLSSVKSISSTSFVDVQGLPMFWNEEGIYQVAPAKQGQSLLNNPLHVNPLEVNPLTVGTILTYYNNIPTQSKKFARGVYNPIDYVIQWIFKSTNETGITDRYTYDSVLILNNHTNAFYPYSFNISNVNSGVPSINSIVYVSSPGGSAAPNSVIKYLTSSLSITGSSFTFSEEKDSTFVDWKSSGNSTNFISTFVTGYRLHGQAQKRFQMPYIYVFSRASGNVSYKIQGIWDFANTGNSGRYSLFQLINNWNPNFGMIYRRHRIRGRGIALQISVQSVDGQPFDIMGWSAYEDITAGI